MKKITLLAMVATLFSALHAETVVDVEGAGAEKIRVSVAVDGNPAFRKTLERNLYLSGAFMLVANGSTATVKVTGSAGAEIAAAGRGKRISFVSKAGDDKSARMEARRFSDAMTETFAGQKGFACDRIVFVCRRGRSDEICVGYADGSDIRQVTQKGKAVVGPRWKDADTILYTGYLNNAPQIFELDFSAGKNKLKWGFGGLTAGAAVAPDGRRAALILSKPFANPELCVIDMASGTWKRLTTTKTANEGQPAWSPDGRSIVYVSDESRRQHLYIIDAASKSKRRVTASGSQNVDPDWCADGRIAYATKRGGQSQIAVVSPAEGDKSASLVTEPGSWEHPSWSRDRRHLVAERDGALFLVDTADGASKPVRLFTIDGKCTMPSWYSRGGGK